MMKYQFHLVVFLFFTLPTILLAQSTAFKKNEIVVGLYERSQVPHDLHSYSTFDRITYKRFLTARTALRATLYRPIDEEETISGGDFVQFTRHKRSQFGLGIEYNIGLQRLRPYIALDLYYSHHQTDYKTSGDVIFPHFYQEEIDSDRFGISPTFGLKYRLWKQFALGWETRLDVFYTHEKRLHPYFNIIYTPYPYPIDTTRSFWDSQFQFGVITLNYSF